MLEYNKLNWTPDDDVPESSQIVMLGVCLGNEVGSGLGPHLEYVDPETLKDAKLSHGEVVRRLTEVKESGWVEECFIWNTCNRFEVYALTRGDTAEVAEYLKGMFFQNVNAWGEGLNRLEGAEVPHHLLRTAVGLNSGLPAEADVEQQLRAAIRLANSAGSFGVESGRLLDEVLDRAGHVRTQTPWSQFAPNYCSAALDGVFEQVGREVLTEGPISIIGSSNTSRACVELLENHYGVEPETITVYHRCHRADGQMKSIRRTTHGCKRKRVADYDTAEVHEAIAGSRFVIFGIDRDEPVLTSEQLESLMKDGDQKVVLVDFNTFGSTSGMETADRVEMINAQDLEVAVRDFAHRMTQADSFREALEVIEPLIHDWAERYAASCASAAVRL